MVTLGRVWLKCENFNPFELTWVLLAPSRGNRGEAALVAAKAEMTIALKPIFSCSLVLMKMQLSDKTRMATAFYTPFLNNHLNSIRQWVHL